MANGKILEMSVRVVKLHLVGLDSVHLVENSKPRVLASLDELVVSSWLHDSVVAASEGPLREGKSKLEGVLLEKVDVGLGKLLFEHHY
jgi:hypothetical protein